MPTAGEPLAAAPDWAAIHEEVLCPLCDYNLRGLIEPRCPECGYRFEWPAVLDPASRRHPYLFEHHPGHNLWSFIKTQRGSWWPKCFWSLLRPAQPSRPHRLLLYALICALPLLLANLLVIGTAGYVLNHFANLYLPPHLSLRSAGRLLARLAYAPIVARLVLISLIWPWATFLALMVFRYSMRRARVRAVHVLRCVVYSFDGQFWLGWVLLGLCLWLALSQSQAGLLFLNGTVGKLAVLGCVLWFAFQFLLARRLALAYRLYLGFDHPAATVLASQVIVVLLALWWLIDTRFFL